MDLLGDDPKLDLRDNKWKISYRHYPDHPHFIGENGSVKNSLIAEGCEIEGTVINSVIFSGVTVEKGAVVKDSVIMRNCRIKESATVNYSILDQNVYVGQDSEVGSERGEGVKLTVLGKGYDVADGDAILPGEIIGGDNYVVSESESFFGQQINEETRKGEAM